MLALPFIVLILTAVVQAHPDGAPLDACDTMRPMHNFYQPQPSATPYTITVSKSTVAVGEGVTVSIAAAGGETFQGFLIKALPSGADTGVAGTFVNNLANAHYLDCSNITQSAVTHTDPSNKTSITVSWYSVTPGTFSFRATVVEYFTTFWVGFNSELITVQ